VRRAFLLVLGLASLGGSAACFVSCSSAEGDQTPIGPVKKKDSGLEEDTGEEDFDTGIDEDTGTEEDTAPDDTAGDSGPLDTSTVDTSVTDSGPTDTGVADVADTAEAAEAAGPVCHAVINEVETGTATSGLDEFIEIFNPCTKSVTITGWKLVYRAEKNLNAVEGADTSTLVTLGAVTIKPYGYVMYAATGGYFDSTTYAPDGTFSGGLVATVGSVGLRDAAGKLQDSVFWGTPLGGFHAFIEGTQVTEAPTTARPGTSIARLPNGTDTEDNSKDFKGAVPTPRAKNF
jgi:hypothetical protein